MKLKLNLSDAKEYSSKAQIARVITEKWVGQNVYCPSCGHSKLFDFPNNSPVADFYCNNCKSEFELKSKKDKLSKKIVDGSFDKMIKRINSVNNPNFMFLNYCGDKYEVKNFLIIPKYFFTNEIIEKRKPLSSNARRAGWIGCNILLQNIPLSGRIFFVKDGIVASPNEVINKWKETSFLSKKNLESRGWLIEIIKIVEDIKTKEFKLQAVYEYEPILKKKFPKNNFIRDKIRQQLQQLRDKGMIEFLGKGKYRKLTGL